MTWSKCSSTIKHKKIKLTDARSKRHALILNPEERPHCRTQGDGCWIVGSTAADWVVSCQETQHQAIVELKGSDVDHACDQILATAAQLKAAGKLLNSVGGLVVCTQYPRNDTKIQRARVEFARNYKGPIHAVTKSDEFFMHKLVSFDGPR